MSESTPRPRGRPPGTGEQTKTKVTVSLTDDLIEWARAYEPRGLSVLLRRLLAQERARRTDTDAGCGG